MWSWSRRRILLWLISKRYRHWNNTKMFWCAHTCTFMKYGYKLLYFFFYAEVVPITCVATISVPCHNPLCSNSFSWFGVVSNLGYERYGNNLVSVKPMIGYVWAGFESALHNTVKILKDANLISCVTSFFIVETNNIFVFICCCRE